MLTKPFEAFTEDACLCVRLFYVIRNARALSRISSYVRARARCNRDDKKYRTTGVLSFPLSTFIVHNVNTRVSIRPSRNSRCPRPLFRNAPVNITRSRYRRLAAYVRGIVRKPYATRADFRRVDLKITERSVIASDVEPQNRLIRMDTDNELREKYRWIW